MNALTKVILATATGSMLYGIGGIPLFGIPVFDNTTLKPAIIILTYFSVMFGPIVGFLVGLIGHWITDLFAGWGIWKTWILGSGIFGLIIGLFPYLTQGRLAQGDSNHRALSLLIILAFLANLLGYGCSAYLDTMINAEPLKKVFTQLTFIVLGNTVLIALTGRLIVKSAAKHSKRKYSSRAV